MKLSGTLPETPAGSLPVYMEWISFSRIGKDLSWSLEKAMPGFVSASNTQMGLMSNSPICIRASSAARKTASIFSDGLISANRVDFGHCSIWTSAHSSRYPKSLPILIIKSLSPTSL
ncbi:hypothetical protein [Parabacteroides goldsteinii]|uniref:hypothetical protein n=1 Tax=Parabacteroides goldsteinii TaxID=328812 RepID=UPI00321B7A18